MLIPELFRSLQIKADDKTVAGFSRAQIIGADAVGLLPMPFILRLWNPGESDYNGIAAAKTVLVLAGESMLASGDIADVCRRSVQEGTMTEVVFSQGLRLWEAPISLSIEAGATVSETVRGILDASGTGISLLAFPENDPVRGRAQAFFGGAVECVLEAVSAVDGRAYLTPSGLVVYRAEEIPVSMLLTEDDLIDAPAFVGKHLAVLRTRVRGWPLGKKISVKWKEISFQGVITERGVDADTKEGNWESQLVVEVEV